MKWGIWAMKSRTYYFNSGLIKNDLKRFYWVMLFYCLALIICLPVKLIYLYSTIEKNKYLGARGIENFERLFSSGSNGGMIFIIMVMPVVVSLCLFGYLHSKKSSDMIHSLPIKRQTIMNSKVLAGFIMLIIPLLINAGICLIIRSGMHIEKMVSLHMIADWFIKGGIGSILIFSISVFMAIICGDCIAQLILTYIALFLPVGLIALICYNLTLLLKGFSGNYYIGIFQDNIIPIVRIGDTAQFSVLDIGSYLLISLIAIIIASLMYKNRKIEKAGKTIVFSRINFVIKYGMTFCFMLVGGLYFAAGDVTNAGWLGFGYLVGALIGYAIAQLTLKKSVYAIKEIKGLIIYGAASSLLVFAINCDIFGFEKYVPKEDQVKSVYFSNYYNQSDYKNNIDVFYNKSIIEKVIKLHEIGIKSKTVTDSNKEGVFLIYELNDGSKVERTYSIDRNTFNKYYKKIYSLENYKKSHYKVFKLEYSNVANISMQIGNQNSIIVKNRDDIVKIVDLLKEDLNKLTYSQLSDSTTRHRSININLKGTRETIYIDITSYFDNVNKYIDEYKKR